MDGSVFAPGMKVVDQYDDWEEYLVLLLVAWGGGRCQVGSAQIG